MMMRGLEAAADWLTPLVDTTTWDYCVVWRLAHDPSRFIEWMDCCCSGAMSQVKVEKADHELSLVHPPDCRDVRRRHPVRTNACEALSHFPAALSLYAGIHGEVAISGQARWLYHNHATSSSASTSSRELFGTQVVIPVHGGLIELFSSNQIHEDQNLVKLVMAQFNGRVVPQVTASLSSVNFGRSPPFSDQPMLESSQAPSLTPSLIPKVQLEYNFHPGLDELSNGYAAPNFDRTNLGPTHNEKMLQLVRNFSSNNTRSCEAVSKQGACFAPKGKRRGRSTQLQGKKCGHAKNLISERNRRDRIKHGLLTLRALVPKITKMDKISTIEDAIDYIVELERKKKRLHDELKDTVDEECKRSDGGSEITVLYKEQDSPSSNEQTPSSNEQTPSSNEQTPYFCNIDTNFGTETKSSPQICVAVNQISESKFFVELSCEHKHGGFVRLMQAIDCLGLHVVNANVIKFWGKVHNSLIVEANKNHISSRTLEDSLTELAR